MASGNGCPKLVSIFIRSLESAIRKEDLMFTEYYARDLPLCYSVGSSKQICMEYSSAIKRNKLLTHATTWMDLQSIMLK